MSFDDYRDAWLNSEVMQLFEKIAVAEGILDGPDPELLAPVDFEKETITEEEEGSDWEDEVEDKEVALEEATEEFVNPKEEVKTEYEKVLANELQSLACDLAENGCVTAAYRIERAILNIRYGRGE